jgi:glycerol-3-phosphate acyltransferase PlsX
MGGDRGPGVVVEGVVEALKNGQKEDLEVILVGRRQEIERELIARDARKLPIELIHADDAVSMTDGGAEVARRKPSSSIAVALALQKEGKAQAFISTGNTGAVVSTALIALGRLSQVRRPAIAQFLPTAAHGCVMLDVGANASVKPVHLLDFGEMGVVYARNILKRENPRVGLLNIGEEETKGNDVVQEAYQLFKRSSLNFVGNVEGRGIFRGDVDVVVCDGFVGNILLKFMESVLGFVKSTMSRQMERDPTAWIGAALLKPVFKEFANSLNYEEYGGAPLLGVNGVCIICHGSSSPKAIQSAIRTAASFVRYGLNEEIDRRIALGESEIR